MSMKGIHYLIDNKGKTTSVLIDLKQWESEWEDFYDILVAKSREHEPHTKWEDIKKKENATIQHRIPSVSAKRVRSA